MRQLHPSVQVVLVGMDASEDWFQNPVRPDISGYFLNEASTPEVIAAIRAV